MPEEKSVVVSSSLWEMIKASVDSALEGIQRFRGLLREMEGLTSDDKELALYRMWRAMLQYIENDVLSAKDFIAMAEEDSKENEVESSDMGFTNADSADAVDGK